MEKKTCNECLVFKDIDQFYPRPGRRHRPISICKACSAVKHRAWYAKNRALHAALQIVVPSDKRCWRCGQTKPSDNFYESKCSIDGLFSACKECARKHAKEVANPARAKRDPGGRFGHLWWKYRLRKHEYFELIERQGGGCGICQSAFVGTPIVDHCHKTGVVRGVLCRKCNHHLAALDKDGFLEQAMRYLKRQDA